MIGHELGKEIRILETIYCSSYYDCIINNFKFSGIKQKFYYAHDFCGSGTFLMGWVGMTSFVPCLSFQLGSSKAGNDLRVVKLVWELIYPHDWCMDATCQLKPQLDLSMWLLRLPHSMVISFQEWVSQKKEAKTVWSFKNLAQKAHGLASSVFMSWPRSTHISTLPINGRSVKVTWSEEHGGREWRYC